MKIAVCSTCDSDDVRCDAFAVWDVTAQAWDLAETFNKGSYCARCDGDTTIVFKQMSR